MSLAHLHMTYAAAASNNQNGRLLFNHNNLTLTGFHSNSSPVVPNLSNHQHLLNAANFHQYQSQQSYLNYQQQYTGATANNNNTNPTPTRSNFAIHDLLGLNNNSNQYFAPLENMTSGGADLVCSPPSSSSSLSHLSNYGPADRFNDSPPQQTFTAAGEEGKKINSVSSDTSPSSSSSSPPNSSLINEAAACAAAAYGAYFGRGGILPGFGNNAPTTTATNTKYNSSIKPLPAPSSEPNQSDLSDGDENPNDEDSFGM